jgi:uncharacterized protein (DUF1778 family)
MQDSLVFVMLMPNRKLYAHCARKSSMSITMAKEERINLRVSSSQKLLLTNAAHARGVSVSEFVLSSASAEAEEALLDRRDFVLTPEAFDQLIEDLSDVKANRATLEKILATPRPWQD